MDGKIFNSRGICVAIVCGPAIFDLKGNKLYDLKASTFTSFPASWLDIWRPRTAPISTWTKQRTGCFRTNDLIKNPSPFGALASARDKPQRPLAPKSSMRNTVPGKGR